MKDENLDKVLLKLKDIHKETYHIFQLSSLPTVFQDKILILWLTFW